MTWIRISDVPCAPGSAMTQRRRRMMRRLACCGKKSNLPGFPYVQPETFVAKRSICQSDVKVVDVVAPPEDPSPPADRARREAARHAIAGGRRPPSTPIASLRGAFARGLAISMARRGPASPTSDPDTDRRGPRRPSTGRDRRRESADRFGGEEDDLPVRSCWW